MITHGQAAISLDEFDQSPKMQQILYILKRSIELGNKFTLFSFNELGTSREAIFIITLLNAKGYAVDIGNDEIIVKEEKR
ncbi:hypothetical protein [Planococcus faecalis]|uniref:Uncharacterized protein n=1 Tax=Planococcus faecalis TaxID=1598147 RepID=A0ABM6IUQ8_9BACL|nr:hypothetical protein [Planococcus faecalis]AQU79759.1 hypothetical protein AJGP001_10990 [Planococcus faecalis]OHX52047.1 hypothetical protein BB777_14030 [Planococcus faecalis]